MATPSTFETKFFRFAENFYSVAKSLFYYQYSVMNHDFYFLAENFGFFQILEDSAKKKHDYFDYDD